MDLHSKNFGIATHLGLELNMPTFGITDNIKHFCSLNDSLNEKYIIDNYNSNCAELYSYMYLINEKNNKTLGVAYNMNKKGPLYISIGNLIELETAVQLIDIINVKNNSLILIFPLPLHHSIIMSNLFI